MSLTTIGWTGTPLRAELVRISREAGRFFRG